MSVIAALVVFSLVALLTYAGYRDGAFFSAYALLRNLFAFLCAMTFCQPLARLLTRLITSTYPAYDYFVVISFATIAAIVFTLSRWLKTKYTVPEVSCFYHVDRTVGPILGMCNGIVVTGMFLILWSLVPFAKYIPADLGRIEVRASWLDTGAAMLRFYSFTEERMGGGRAFLLQDEPINTDRNENLRADVGDSYLDVNRNGRWDRGWLWKYRNYADINPSDLNTLLRTPET